MEYLIDFTNSSISFAGSIRETDICKQKKNIL